MAVNEKLVERIRAALSGRKNVEEKKMFRGITFMVNGKMCVSASGDNLMCRIDPSLHDMAVKKKGCQTVKMKGREYRGYIYVSEEGMKSQEDFDYWIALALEFNKKAKASRKKE
jgi:TfoX/Sxy family transcriptional regulator of competence genes